MIAKLNNFRHSPRKTIKVVDLIRNKSVLKSEQLLFSLNKKAAVHLGKLLKSAVSNAVSEGKNPAYLYISHISVGRAQKYKRLDIRARLHRGRIEKEGCNILIKLQEKNLDKEKDFGTIKGENNG
jgi:ribosomal protein L22